MGKVRTDTVKRVSRELLRRFPDHFTGEWEADKQAVNQLVTTPSKGLRNRIAGYVVTLKTAEAERAKRGAAAPTETEALPYLTDGSAADDHIDYPGSPRGRGRPSGSGRRRRRRI